MSAEREPTPWDQDFERLSGAVEVWAARVLKEVDDLHRSGRTQEAVALMRREMREIGRLETGADATDLRREISARVVTFDPDQLAAPPKPRDWLLMRPAERGERGDQRGRVGVFPSGKVGMLAAAGGIGKTSALVRLALAVATGRPWFGEGSWAPTAAGRVLLALGEEDKEEVQRRLHNSMQAMKLDHADIENAASRILVLPLAGLPTPFVESGERGPVEGCAVAEIQRVLKEHAGDTGWRLLIFDPLSRFAGQDAEKDNAQATRAIQAFETLVSAPGDPGVLIAHHTSQESRTKGKGSASAARGVTGLTDGVRWVATLTPKRDDQDGDSPEWVELSIAKTNYGPRAEPVRLRCDDRGVLGPHDGWDAAERTAGQHGHGRRNRRDSDGISAPLPGMPPQ